MPWQHSTFGYGMQPKEKKKRRIDRKHLMNVQITRTMVSVTTAGYSVYV